jgi:hypothetical protein
MSITEWDRRELCPDGACIGVIGGDGTCSVCGKAAPNWGDERRRGLVAAEDDEADGEDDDDHDDDDDEADDFDDGIGGDDDDDDDDEDDDEGDDDDGGSVRASRPAGGNDWNARQLCADEACIGVIGRDGTCNACGKPAKA